MIGHTRSGGFCSEASETAVIADASDIAGGDSGRSVPDGVEHRGEARVAAITGLSSLSTGSLSLTDADARHVVTTYRLVCLGDHVGFESSDYTPAMLNAEA